MSPRRKKPDVLKDAPPDGEWLTRPLQKPRAVQIRSVQSGAAEPVRIAARLYCDESGNTGPNYIDAGQPFYVLAALLIPKDAEATVEASLSQLAKEARLNGAEAKGSRLFRSAKRTRALTSFLERLLRTPVEFFVCLYEKRYGLCGRIVDDCLDGAYNPRVHIGLTGDDDAKRIIADQIYKLLPDSVLEPWAEAWRHGRAADLKRATHSMCQSLRRRRARTLGRMIEGSVDATDEIVGQGEKRGYLESVNFPVFTGVLSLAEYFCELKGFGPVEIIHDEIRGFGEAYQNHVTQFQARNGEQAATIWGTHEQPFVWSFRRLQSLRTANSAQTVGLQAADVVASAVAGFARKACYEPPVREDLAGIREFLEQLSARYERKPSSGILYCTSSEAGARIIGPPLFPRITKSLKESHP